MDLRKDVEAAGVVVIPGKQSSQLSCRDEASTVEVVKKVRKFHLRRSVDVLGDASVALCVIKLAQRFRVVLCCWHYYPFSALVRGRNRNGSVRPQSLEFITLGRSQIVALVATSALTKDGINRGFQLLARSH